MGSRPAARFPLKYGGNRWPLGTIAKEHGERKGKTAKNIVKMGFFRTKREKLQVKCGFSTPYRLGRAPEWLCAAREMPDPSRSWRWLGCRRNSFRARCARRERERFRREGQSRAGRTGL